VCLLLLVGAMAKSAQFGFHVWLPDAMEGPTPVSALLHSATMVTAGVFLLIRLNPLFEASELVCSVIVGVGVLTALLAGSVALAQTDLKRVIAYSTCSQLGFMFIAIGVSAYGLAFFHLITHAFFKSLLFLGAGIVITKSNHVQDITRMGGMRRQLPITHGVMLLGTLALVGMPLFSGAVSKDLILEAAWAYPGQQGLGALAYYGGLVAVALTALYAWRLMILVFYGPTRTAQDIKAAPRERTDLWKMWLPTLPLAVAALGLGALLKPWFVGEGALWQGVMSFGDLALRLERVHQAPWVSLLVVAVVILSTLTAFAAFWWRAFNDQWLHSKMGRVLFAQAFFNERYHKVFVQPVLAVGRWLSWSDQAVIDHWGPEGVGRGVKRFSGWICRLQSGYLYRYALWMILGMLGILAIPLIWMMRGGG
jgi:NADH-quinone oxidoreductase subunit L